ncbi:MAG: hypothetical protein ACJA19_000940 [Bacteroidia bacterium]
MGVRHNKSRLKIKMNSIKKTSFFVIIALGMIWILTSSFQKTNELTKEQAIELAEQFIIDNGYTALPANKSKLNYELFDRYENDVDSVLIRRSNTLHKKAFCISEGDDRWNVGFLSTSVDINKLDSTKRQTDLSGRAIIVMKDGKEIRIAHKEPLFSYFEKLRVE